MVVWRWLVRVLAAGAAIIAVVQPCLAQDGEPDAASPAAGTPWREVAIGGSVVPSGWSLYSSTTLAPFGGLDQNGARLRLGSGYGRYTYDRPRHCYDMIKKIELACAAERISGRATFADILAGYRLGVGRFTAQAFAGLALDNQMLSPFDGNNASAGRATGVKVALETWTNLTPVLWAAIDGSWTSAHAATSARARLGYRFWPRLSLGIEQAHFRNVAGQQSRGGLFARYEWSGGEASLSGGISAERLDFTDASRDHIWAAVDVMFRY